MASADSTAKTGGAIMQKAADTTEHGERRYTVESTPQGHAGNTLYGNELDTIRWVLFYAVEATFTR